MAIVRTIEVNKSIQGPYDKPNAVFTSVDIYYQIESSVYTTINGKLCELIGVNNDIASVIIDGKKMLIHVYHLRRVYLEHYRYDNVLYKGFRKLFNVKYKTYSTIRKVKIPTDISADAQEDTRYYTKHKQVENLNKNIAHGLRVA